jgi:putative ABC transport system substrate-binding protein
VPSIQAAASSFAIEVLARETKTIPIVFAGVSDPIGSGFAANFTHPGGNITGFTVNDPTVRGAGYFLGTTETILGSLIFLGYWSPRLGILGALGSIHAKDEIEGVIAAQARNPGGGLFVMPDVYNDANRELIIALTARYGVPFRG